MNEKIESLSKKTKEVSQKIGSKLAETGKLAKETAGTIGNTIFDQDGDGVVTQNDVRILSEKGKEVSKKAANEVIIIAKEAKKSDLVKEAAAGAIIGALIAIPIPILGPAMGAAIGAAIALVIYIKKK